MRKTFVLLCFLCLSSCASSPPHVTIQEDEFHRNIQLNGPLGTSHPYTLSHENMSRIWEIQTLINKDTGAVNHRLYVHFKYYTDLKYFNTASDDSGQKLKVKSLYREGGHCGVDNCKRIEDIAIALQEKDLRSHMAEGYKIRISAKAGNAYTFLLTPTMIRLQLEAMTQYLHQLHSK